MISFFLVQIINDEKMSWVAKLLFYMDMSELWKVFNYEKYARNEYKYL